MKVPFFDLKEQYRQDGPSVERVVKKVCASGHFILGPHVEALEQRIADFCQTKFAVGVASGSDALWLALMALGVKPGDEVITTSYTFIVTATAIVKAGARPVFADVEPDGFSIDPDQVKRLISKKTRVILPVHLFGLCAPIQELKALVRNKGIVILEDAAQSLGARIGKDASGSMGEAAALSFYPTKNLGGAGDGGMVVTNDEKTARQIKILRAHGAQKKYFHKFLGWNSRLDEIQAAILEVKLKRLKTLIQARRNVVKIYLEGLKELPLKLPKEPNNFYHTYNQFTIRTSFRDRLRSFLEKKGIGTEIYYPWPLHLQPCFSMLGYKKGNFPNAELRAQESLSLPIFPELKPSQVDFVIQTISKFFKTEL
ncbi:MAG: DegT/DnrJ/EryC1/StrS family aminotransferase [Chlamydiae bacterium]|nr:DegT/DnrJ/EryC1/StrS family aminotransferase [Chlamydiota bacterium]MBI3277346.1 DegT/DnrJ/EryC1/StrS family aminotransferase [Chlamydiota bacterium]